MLDLTKSMLLHLERQLEEAENRLTRAGEAFDKAEAERNAALDARNALYNLVRDFRDYSEGTRSEVPL